MTARDVDKAMTVLWASMKEIRRLSLGNQDPEAFDPVCARIEQTVDQVETLLHQVAATVPNTPHLLAHELKLLDLAERVPAAEWIILDADLGGITIGEATTSKVVASVPMGEHAQLFATFITQAKQYARQLLETLNRARELSHERSMAIVDTRDACQQAYDALIMVATDSDATPDDLHAAITAAVKHLRTTFSMHVGDASRPASTDVR